MSIDDAGVWLPGVSVSESSTERRCSMTSSPSLLQLISSDVLSLRVHILLFIEHFPENKRAKRM